jgi:hypothetical protein
MKHSILFLAFVLFLYFNVQAQFPPPFRPPMPPMNFNNFYSSPDNKPFKVFMKDGRIIEGEGTIWNTIKGSYVYKKNTSIYANQTDSIIFNSQKGYEYENQWIYSAIQGKLTLYKLIDNEERKKYSYLKKNNIMIEYNYSNLLKAVSDDKKARSLVNSKRIGLGVTWGLLIVGAGMTIYGFPASFTKEKRLIDNEMVDYGVFKTNPCLIIGPICLVASLPVYFGTKNKANKAITYYNNKN